MTRLRVLLTRGTALSGAVLATVVKPLPLAEQAAKANVIVQAKVAEVRDAQRDGVAWKVYRLTVSETVAGDAGSLPKLENDPALWILAGVDDAPTLKVGDEAVMLLYTGTFDSPIVGFNQGLYRLQDGKIVGGEPTDPAQFKRALASFRGGAR